MLLLGTRLIRIERCIFRGCGVVAACFAVLSRVGIDAVLVHQILLVVAMYGGCLEAACGQGVAGGGGLACGLETSS